VDCLPSVQSRRVDCRSRCDKGEAVRPLLRPHQREGHRSVHSEWGSPSIRAGIRRVLRDVRHCVPDSILSIGSERRPYPRTRARVSRICVAGRVLRCRDRRHPRVVRSAPPILEGRCLPPCLPSVASQKDKLDVGSCTRVCVAPPASTRSAGRARALAHKTGQAEGGKKVFPNCCGARDVRSRRRSWPLRS